MAINLSPMLAKDFKGTFVNHIVMRKLNGVRAVFYHDQFYSRDGEEWNDGVLGHIKPPSCYWPLDGELYCHGMPLQEINERVAVKRLEPHRDSAIIQFHVFDVMNDEEALPRMHRLKELFGNYRTHRENCELEKFEIAAGHCDCLVDLIDVARETGYEGLMLKAPLGTYYHSDYKNRRSDNLLKLKFYQYGNYVCQDIIGGEGKAFEVTGTMKFQTSQGLDFEVGTFRCSYQQRAMFLANRRQYIGRMAKLQYVELSNDGIPQNASFIDWI